MQILKNNLRLVYERWTDPGGGVAGGMAPLPPKTFLERVDGTLELAGFTPYDVRQILTLGEDWLKDVVLEVLPELDSEGLEVYAWAEKQGQEERLVVRVMEAREKE